MQNKKGFTLIELLVVVLIIGILAAVALPQYQKAVEKARLTEALNMLSSLQKAVEAWKLANETTFTELIGCQTKEQGLCNELDIDIENILSCDVGGGEYCRSKNFAYDGNCDRSSCFIYAARSENGDYDNEMIQYEIWMNRDNTTGQWQKKYSCNEGYPYTKSICQELKNQGWTQG